MLGPNLAQKLSHLVGTVPKCVQRAYAKWESFRLAHEATQAKFESYKVCNFGLFCLLFFS